MTDHNRTTKVLGATHEKFVFPASQVTESHQHQTSEAFKLENRTGAAAAASSIARQRDKGQEFRLSTHGSGSKKGKESPA